jgi:hypothetical protein
MCEIAGLERTYADSRAIAVALESYGEANGEYPTAQSMDELTSQLVPEHAAHLPMMDGWGRPFRIASTSTGCELRSAGKDGQPGSAALPMIRLGEERMTGLAYTKGGVFFAVMQELIGEDAFHRIVRSHYERFAPGGATTEQFVETCRAVVGTRLDRLLDEWLFGASSSELFQSNATLQQMVERYR